MCSVTLQVYITLNVGGKSSKGQTVTLVKKGIFFSSCLAMHGTVWGYCEEYCWELSINSWEVLLLQSNAISWKQEQRELCARSTKHKTRVEDRCGRPQRHRLDTRPWIVCPPATFEVSSSAFSGDRIPVFTLRTLGLLIVDHYHLEPPLCHLWNIWKISYSFCSFSTFFCYRLRDMKTFHALLAFVRSSSSTN